MNTEGINPQLTTKIVASYVAHHKLGLDQLPDLIASIYRAIGQLGQPLEPDKVLTPAVSVRRSVHRDYVICLDCGYRGKTLRRHISTQHGLSRDEYRQRWGLRSNHPRTAPASSGLRSRMAKARGFGHKLAVPVVPTQKPAVSPAPVDTARKPRARRPNRSRPASKLNVEAAAAVTSARKGRSRARVATSSG